ncbi:ABC transporter ATP-binding protein [Desulfosporosinus youngiae]|uniref:ABC-type multidrug transport system, ATPase component n=1 Tax=Desulfosporosinus youngiae DSM 17734 TaxID=768710 RepID=H5Y3J3_9FIRM|nr:ABC transporter ATP-binding protein [Desulfosporosinus youngiae]EHQ89102.1 ABC-type multidrug transport system, ATPase component [Desulfosporosinus youngiae DSM 17734]
MNVIHIQKLSKSFGKTQALKGIDLTVEQGEIHGFIGPNGAGKSTTIRILLGILKKSSGEIRLLGGDPWRDAVELHRRLVYVPGDVTLWPDLSGGEIIDFLGRLHGGLNLSRKRQLLERFQLDPTKKSGTYSKGNRQKVALVSAFSCEAELYLLDEPTSGLDPLMEAVFQECVADVKKAGKTVLLSSHILSEVEALCNRVSIIRQGQIVESGTLSQLRHLTRTTVNVETGRSAVELEKLSGVHDVSREGLKYRFSVDSKAMTEVMGALLPLGIKSLTVEPPSLEELFMRHYGDDLHEKGGAWFEKN